MIIHSTLLDRSQASAMSDVMLMDENRKKLELETQSLSLMREMSQKCCAHTTSIETILSEFDERLAKVQRNIQPVYEETVNLQSKQADLVKTLKRLDYVIQFYSVTDEVAETIRAGPANQLELYMQCLKNLKLSIQYFSQHNSSSPEYQNVAPLFDQGCEAVKREFEDILKRHSSPIAPVALLDIINDDISEQQLDSTNSINTTTTTSTNGSIRRHQPELPHDNIEDLRVMCEWLCNNCNEDLIKIYVEKRSMYITKSLRLLQDYQKDQNVTFSMMNSSTSSTQGGSSRNSIDSPDLALNKKRIGVAGSTSSHRPREPKSIQLAFKRKLHYVIPGDVSHKLSSSSIDDAPITEREIVSYLTCITAFHKLSVNELNLMSEIIPADLKTPIYNQLIRNSLALITDEADSLTTRVKNSIKKQNFKSALNLFPILRHQTLRRHNFDLLFEGCQSEELKKFQGLTITFQTTISTSLHEFASFVLTDSDIKVPGDGTVHELTNNVMIFVEQLQEYLDILSIVIPVKDMQAMENTTDKNRLSFAHYITCLLDALGKTIQRKAQAYTNLHLVFLFKLNNFQYILKRLKESGLLEIVHSYNQNVRDIYEELIAHSKTEYVKSLYPVLNYLQNLQETSPKLIKSRFTGFNKEFQELHRLNKTYAVPDQELRSQLREACKREFLPHYRQFYNFCMGQEFTKNKEKYAKYPPELVASMIDQFFESN